MAGAKPRRQADAAGTARNPDVLNHLAGVGWHHRGQSIRRLPTGVATTESSYIAPRLAGIGPRLAWRVRRRIFNEMIETLRPSAGWKVLDVGVTSDRTPDSNFFERLYPYPEQITAAGLEDASFLEDEYPGLRFIRADACELPFSDNTFDLAFCSAVIEHVGCRSNQMHLLKEITRVSRIAVVTTPNRYFPVEFHTLTPFLHWLPAQLFRLFLRYTGRQFFSLEENLNLLSEAEMDTMTQREGLSSRKHPQYLWGMKSNLVYYLSSGHNNLFA